MKLNLDLLLAELEKTNTCYLDMWHATQKSTKITKVLLNDTFPSVGG